jgi:hypothetical protein
MSARTSGHELPFHTPEGHLPLRHSGVQRQLRSMKESASASSIRQHLLSAMHDAKSALNDVRFMSAVMQVQSG